jgi:hypothetical protein
MFIKNIKRDKLRVYAVLFANINRALKPKPTVNIDELLPPQYHPWKQAFDRTLANTLAQHPPDVDLRIPIEKDANGENKPLSWGPMYGMNRDELLVLRKILTDLLDKKFIRISNSAAAAPVLLAHKPGGGVRFCVNYRALNKITVKDRYPLSLISETLRNIAKAKWYTKLDIISAFYQMRIAKGEKWKTAFHIRFDLYE